MPITQRNKIGMLEAMLFANAEPVETDRLAEAMRARPGRGADPAGKAAKAL